MGEMADMMIDEAQHDFDRMFEVDETPKFIWTSKDGTRWTPDNMEKSHLKNCINYCKRRLVTDKYAIKMFKKELKRRKKEMPKGVL